jgi:hypothetical protein
VDAQLLVNEVQVDREAGLGGGLVHGPGGDAPAGEVEGQVPPVVASHAGGQPDLPDDLAEPVQRGLGVLPFGQRHRWEQLDACTLQSRALSTPDIPPVCLASAMLSSRRR